MKLDGIREKVFLDRYSLKDKAGKPMEKTPDEMWKRVAKGIAGVEKPKNRKKWEKKFNELMQDFKFLPGGRILAGAGTGFDVTYYNCFVIPNPPDSRGGIMANLTQMIEIMAHGGGVGLNLSSLRPRGSRVKKVNGFSSGPINWAELYSLATKDIVQQGGSRRGALMLMLWDWHPDIEEFITVKQDLNKINGANLSVCLSDAFMEAVKKNGDWDLVYPDLDDPKYDKKWTGDLNAWKKIGGKVKVLKTIKAKYLWDLICTAAWQSAEPGLHFLDRSNKRSNTYYFETLIATNPCGEQPLSAWAVCNLGAINLSAYVKNKQFDYDNFAKDVQVATRFLDNVIDDTYYFYKENEKVAKDIRRQGLGILGLADALIKMEVRYGSEDSLKIIDKIFKTLRDNAYTASSDIAKEKGSFPKYNKEKYQKGFHIQNLPKEIRAKIAKQGIRNAVLLTIAPTGSTSLLSGVSSGVEPVYEFEYTRRDRLGEHKMYHPLFEEWKKQHPDEKKPDYFASANDLSPEDHVKVQAVAQGYIDSSISKTVNAPKGHTVEDVERLYMLAYDMGLKGITYMRDGSRAGVLERIEEKKEPVVVPQVQTALPVIPRPNMVEGVTYGTDTPVGKTFITINHDENKQPFEVFITVGKSGSDVAAMADALGRMISLNLRLNGALAPRERIRQVVAQLIGIGGARSVGFGEYKVRSLPDAIAKVLSKHFEFKVNGVVEDRNPNAHNGNGVNAHLNGHSLPIAADAAPREEEIIKIEQLSLQTPGGALSNDETATSLYDICPECGAASFAYEEGCKKCYACGYSEC
ncbi:MAG TPA: adenosylcobalamin-dependent ribonucleoside-diphosphate reductase [Patescibacteria group bacterium]|jgi:ribonucleoside-diphosphate reductase alpha chain|nr:adenosylcobalamin-dependent ribonucleoside-diphosphate reductase [Patescibacteria group bacterium]